MTASSSQRAALAGDPICTTSDAARHLGVSVSTAQLWMEKGTLASWKTPGGHRRCRLSDIQRLQGNGARAASEVCAEVDAEFVRPPQAGYPMGEAEQQRLLALADSGLMDSPADPYYDRIAWLATQLTGCPMALVSLLSTRRQWFKARVGVEVSETPREHAFCSYAIVEPDGLVVHDACADARFRDNPLVVGAPHIRFYAGVPVIDGAGNCLGTLCVLDTEPRTLSEGQMKGLRELANIVNANIARSV